MLREMLATGICRLPFRLRYKLFRETARSFGICSVIAPGPLGPLEGHLDDWTIFRRYVANAGDWSGIVPAFADRFFQRLGAGGYIDVGANIGQTFIPVITRNSVAGFAIEAAPFNAAALRANCARSIPADRSYRIIEAAVYERPGRINLVLDPYNQGNNHIAYGEAGVAVAAVTLDAAIPHPPEPLLIKADIQGAEPYIFTGGAETVGRCQAMVIEFSPLLSQDMGIDVDAFIDEAAGIFPTAVNSWDFEGSGIFAPEQATRDCLQRIQRQATAVAECHRDYYEDVILLKPGTWATLTGRA